MAGYKGHKLGSPRERLHIALDEKGEAAALALGVELGIVEKRVRRWIKKWSYVAHTSRPVVWKFDPDQRGALVLRGDEVSQIRWNDGREEYVTNENFIELNGETNADDGEAGQDNPAKRHRVRTPRLRRGRLRSGAEADGVAGDD